MPSLETLRLTWERRVSSILRIIVGMLYMEHGFAKILDFPHQSTHVPYAPFTLNPALQGLLEFVGGLLPRWASSPALSPLCSQATWPWPTSWCTRPRGFFPLLNGGELAIVYCFVFLYFWLAGGGEWSLDRLRASTPVSSVSPRRA